MLFLIAFSLKCGAKIGVLFLIANFFGEKNCNTFKIADLQAYRGGNRKG